MKKLLFVFPIVALLAAGCNSSQQSSVQTQNTNHISTSTHPSTKTQLDSPNWKTYNNTSLGFQIKYPPDWTYTNDGSLVVFYPPGGSGYTHFGDFTLGIQSNPKQLDLKTFYQAQDFNPFTQSSSQTDSTINGYSAEKFIGIQANNNFDQYSVDMGSFIIELTDNGQQHESDGLAATMANSITASH